MLLPTAAQSRPAASVEPTDTMVAGVTLEFRERRDRTRDALAAGVRALFARKQAIDRRVDAAHARVGASVARQNAIQARWTDLRRRARVTRDALWRLQLAERRLPQEGVEAHASVITQTGRRIARLEAAIVARTRAGSGTAAHRRQLAKARTALAAVEQGVVDRGPRGTRDLRRRWLALQRDLHEDLFQLHVGNAAAERARAEALDELTALRRERDEVDQLSFDAAARLGALDYDVREVRVRAAGREVFRADGSSDLFERIRRYEEDRRLAQQAQDALRPEFDRIRNAFYAAQREVIASEADLAARLDYLAVARFTTDLAFAFLDVAMAYGSSGPVGAVTELVRKAAESRLSIPAGSGYEPGSIEAEVNARYRAGLKDALTYPQLMKTGMERVAKETLTKPAKDVLNRALATALFGPLGHRLPAEPTGAGGRPLNATALRSLLRAPERLGHTDAQIKKLREGGTSLRSLGVTMLKDVAKVAAKSSLDDYEREAWITFFERDLYARTRFALYAVVRDLYAQAEETRIWNEERLLGLAAGAETRLTGFTNRVQRPFASTDQLEIDVRVATLVPAETLDFAVVAGGRRLEPVARRREGDDVYLTYRVGAGAVDRYFASGFWQFPIAVR